MKARKLIGTALLTVCLLLAFATSVLAWYAINERLARTQNMEINMPPIIYVKDDHLQEMTSFHLDGLKIGEEYNAVFCVSPALLNSVGRFFLGVIYTENMGMEINLYPVTGVTDTKPTEGAYEPREIGPEGSRQVCYFRFDNSVVGTVTYGDWETASRPVDSNLNTGIFKAYNGLQFAANETEYGSELLKTLNDTSRYRFFVLNITWPEDAVENAKEVDIVYIVSKGSRGGGT